MKRKRLPRPSRPPWRMEGRRKPPQMTSQWLNTEELKPCPLSLVSSHSLFLSDFSFRRQKKLAFLDVKISSCPYVISSWSIWHLYVYVYVQETRPLRSSAQLAPWQILLCIWQQFSTWRVSLPPHSLMSSVEPPTWHLFLELTSLTLTSDATKLWVLLRSLLSW